MFFAPGPKIVLQHYLPKPEAGPFIHSITRDCLDYVLLFSERHLCYLRESCQRYYSEARTHLGV